MIIFSSFLVGKRAIGECFGLFGYLGDIIRRSDSLDSRLPFAVCRCLKTELET